MDACAFSNNRVSVGCVDGSVGKILGYSEVPTAIMLDASIVRRKPQYPEEENPHCYQKIDLYPEILTAKAMVLQYRFDSSAIHLGAYSLSIYCPSENETILFARDP